jgi:predicted metal-dependent HD superfamily phosphohydrolase
MVSPERVDAMQRSWVNLLAPFGVTPTAAYPPFDRLVEAHAEPHRHYHTLEHVGEVLRVVGRLKGGPAGQLAAWFHDAVYDSRAKDNETRSAELAVWELSAVGLPDEVTLRVAELVRSTAHFDGGTFTGPEFDALHDADLAILGASEVRYERYAADVRKEYAWVPDADYRAGRRKVLESFLARERIYRTDVMFAEGEEAARRNMAAEVSALSQPTSIRSPP